MIRDAIGPDRGIPSSGSYSSETLQLDDADIGQIYSPLKDFEELPSSPFRKRVRPDDTRVEGPLTPPMVLHNPLSQAKNVSFKEMLDEIIPNLPPPLEEPSDMSLQDIESFFEEAVAPMAENFNRKVEQEQLQEADSTKRVDIPLMDFSLPVPPWTIYTRNPSANNLGNPTELDSQRRLIPEMKELHLKNHRWPGVAQLEFKLAWCPFPKELGIVATQESIEDDGSISDFLAGLNVSDAFDSSTVTWKQEGIRVLDFNDDSDEEELQPGVFEEDSDMNSLLRKRNLELEETTETPSLILPEGHVSHRLGMKSADITNSMTKVDPIVPSRQEVQETSNKQQGRALLGGSFSALSALDNFMGVRGEILKKPKLMDSPYFAASDENQRIKSIPVVTEAPKRQKDKKPLPLPELNPPCTTRQFIVSSAILAQRRVVRQLRNLYPTADFIERDFASFNNSSAKPHQTSLDTFSVEADIIISSSTGLIWTTLQIIKQRALPGQASYSPIRDRIASLSQKYERLVVIVSEGRESKYESEAAASTSSWAYSGLDVKDCEALTGLIGFCGTLEADIVVLYTGGGEYEHARWIAGVMIKYSVGEPTAGLLQDETLWELFLRRAGLNAFAAQEILAALKAPDQGGSLDSSQREGIDYGLGAFVKMPVTERVRRFERLLGGTRVLLNVSRLIDVRWQ